MAAEHRKPIKLVYFASAKEFIGLSSEVYPLNPSIVTGADIVNCVK